MKTTRLLIASSSLALLTLAACSEAPVAPTALARSIAGTSAAMVGDFNPANIDNKFVVCKQGTAGVITVSGTTPDGAFNQDFSLNTDGTDNTADDCTVAYQSTANALVTLRATEDPAKNAGTTLSQINFFRDTDGSDNSIIVDATSVQQSYTTAFHGFVAIFVNEAESNSCTFTKGWYRNKGNNTFNGVDGRTKEEAQQIFAATPGKPGNVTFGGNNSLLNLYQQYLAAVLNGGLNGPAAVAQAIADNAGDFGAGLNITTTLTKAEISALTELLSNYNEGKFNGFPHCG